PPKKRVNFVLPSLVRYAIFREAALETIKIGTQFCHRGLALLSRGLDAGQLFAFGKTKDSGVRNDGIDRRLRTEHAGKNIDDTKTCFERVGQGREGRRKRGHASQFSQLVSISLKNYDRMNVFLTRQSIQRCYQSGVLRALTQ